MDPSVTQFIVRPRIRVSRKTKDDLGDLMPGDLPPHERVNLWPENNFRAMMKTGFIAVYGGDQKPDLMPGAEEAAAKAKAKAQAKKDKAEAEVKAAAKAKAKAAKKTTKKPAKNGGKKKAAKKPAKNGGKKKAAKKTTKKPAKNKG